VAGALKICPNAASCLRIDCQRVAPSALARHAQGIVPAVLVQIADRQRRDFGAAQSDLQADGKDGAIAQATDQRRAPQRFGLRRLDRGRVEQFACLHL
jgi:hypothetical protein